MFLLPLGGTVTIGRKASCDIVTRSHLVSSLHCKVQVLSPSKFVLVDSSKNGTWISRARAGGGLSSKAGPSGGDHKVEKLCHGESRVLHNDDIIMLLAPGHELNADFRYRLVCDIEEGGKHFLKHLCHLGKGSGGGGGGGGSGVKRRSTEGTPSDSQHMKKARVSNADGPDEAVPVPIPSGVDVSDEAMSVPILASTPINKKLLETSQEEDEEEDMERCPSCRKLFHVLDLPVHCPACQEAGRAEVSSSSHRELKTTSSMEECSNCSEIFPADMLASHVEECKGDAAYNHCSNCSQIFPADMLASHVEECDGDIKRNRDSYGECPHCSAVLPILDLIGHSATCQTMDRSGAPSTSSGWAVCDEVVEVDSARECSAGASKGSVGATHEAGESGAGGGEVEMLELEQCAFCLEDFPLCEMVDHYSECTCKTKSDVEEHCEHCLAVFPLDELIRHATNCSQRKTAESAARSGAGEPLEKCMHCFEDFPLSELVSHSNSCTSDVSGARERFKNFIPSVHDLDSMAVLTVAQSEAVKFVIRKSKIDSEVLYPHLKKRVIHLGYSEDDLRGTLQWIRSDAPIIIHLDLSKCLRFLVKDTHYRNLFETKTGGGGNSTNDRKKWENRIFNRLYDSKVSAFERVKYGVLNIVGDPRGVQCCSRYGDSFLQLKKVRLRTTFASADTCNSNVKVSCCEHYGNVLYEYSDMELKAVIDVATRRKSFLQSAVISNYKEVQVHGPVSLSDNIDCVVANERHKSCSATREMLDSFVDRNKCNLIWMQPANSIEYPRFDIPPAPSH